MARSRQLGDRPWPFSADNGWPTDGNDLPLAHPARTYDHAVLNNEWHRAAATADPSRPCPPPLPDRDTWIAEQVAGNLDRARAMLRHRFEECGLETRARGYLASLQKSPTRAKAKGDLASLRKVVRRRLELEGELLVGQGSPPIPAANLARIEANLAAPDLVAVRADLIQISRKVAAPDVDLSAPERWALDVSGYLSSREMAGLLAEDRATLDQSTGTTRRAKAEEARESTRSAGKRRVRVLRKIGAL